MLWEAACFAYIVPVQVCNCQDRVSDFLWPWSVRCRIALPVAVCPRVIPKEGVAEPLNFDTPNSKHEFFNFQWPVENKQQEQKQIVYQFVIINHFLTIYISIIANSSYFLWITWWIKHTEHPRRAAPAASVPAAPSSAPSAPVPPPAPPAQTAEAAAASPQPAEAAPEPQETPSREVKPAQLGPWDSANSWKMVKIQWNPWIFWCFWKLWGEVLLILMWGICFFFWGGGKGRKT